MKLDATYVRERNAQLFVNGDVVTGDSVDVNQGDTITVKCNSGYTFVDKKTCDSSSNCTFDKSVCHVQIFSYGSFKSILGTRISDSELMLDYGAVYGDPFDAQSWTWKALETEGGSVEPEPETPILELNVKQFTDKNCYLVVNGEKVDGDLVEIFENDSIYVHTNPDYLFLDDIVYDDFTGATYLGKNALVISYHGAFSGDIYNFSCDPSDLSKADISKIKDKAGVGTSFRVTVLEVVKIEENDIAGLNKVYLLNLDLLRKVTRARFVTGFVGGNGERIDDFGQYIINVMQLPFVVPDLETEEENIYLATHDTEIKAPSLNIDHLTLDLGKITTPNRFNDFRDYLETTIQLNLPYAEAVELDAKMVIGQTIGIEYIINCYTGVATINITSDRVGGGIIFTKSTNLGFNVPLANVYNDPKSFGSNNVDFGGLNHVTKPYIEVIRNNVVNFDGTFNIPVVDSGLLSSFSGYIKVNDVTISGVAISDYEKSLLENVLKQGVFIND